MYRDALRGVFWHLVEEGLSTAAICRRLGISRQTAYNWKAAGRSSVAAYGPRSGAGSILDPYKELIAVRLGEFPRLSAVRLFAEVQAAGYPGGYDLVKRHVRELRPRPAKEPVVRFETEPGHQGQVDFAQFRLPWGKRYALLVVLGYSRLLWFQFYARQTMEVLMRGLEAAFTYFGGVPAELLFDQLKAVIIEDRRASAGELLRNQRFQRFAAYHGFTTRACRPYRAQTKGKVERPVRFVRDGFFYARSFVSDADLNAQALHWLATVANPRVHGTLKEVPLVRFERERGLLGPFVERPYADVLSTPPELAEDVRPAPRLVVERRSLAEYGRLVEVAG